MLYDTSLQLPRTEDTTERDDGHCYEVSSLVAERDVAKPDQPFQDDNLIYAGVNNAQGASEEDWY